MKRTCSTHKEAQFVCISDFCKQKCSYICSLPNDACKQEHQACSLVALSYITKKCMKIQNKQRSLNMKELSTIYNQTKKILQKFQDLFQQKQNALKVRTMLDPHGLFKFQQKQILIDFIKNDQHKLKSPQQKFSISQQWIEKQLINLNLQISIYLKSLKEDKRILEEDQVIRSQNKIPSSIKKSQFHQKQKEKGSAIDKIRSQSKGPTPVKSKNLDFQKQSPPNLRKSSKITKVGNPGSFSNGFQAMMSSVVKNNVPVGPLFSKITNDIETLQTFFYQKFSGANLLYRASQNGFSASKFHQKCDGVKNTLTILITQYDKIIGGFTPLPWKSSGDWYEDETQSSFIFNLSSGQRYPLQNKSKAIWCSHTYGPSFGYPDLQIADKAFYNGNSCVNFPQYYNNGNYNEGTGSIQILCGTKTGHFRIKQWQVYELQF